MIEAFLTVDSASSTQFFSQVVSRDLTLCPYPRLMGLLTPAQSGPEWAANLWQIVLLLKFIALVQIALTEQEWQAQDWQQDKLEEGDVVLILMFLLFF